MNEASSRVGSGRPIDASVSSAIRVPIGTWPPSPVFPMSCSRAPRRSASGSVVSSTASRSTGSSGSGAASIDDIPVSAVVRCVSTVYRWYGSRWGRHRTATHAGRNRASSPSRSSVSSACAAGSPARSNRRNASRTSGPHATGSGTSAASISSRSCGEAGTPASAVRARASRTPTGPRIDSPGTPVTSVAPPARRATASARIRETCRACSNTARIRPSSAISRGSSVNPIARAIEGWWSSTSRSVRRPASRCSALRTRVRNSSAASRTARSRSRSGTPPPLTSSSQRTVWMSRSPPAPSLSSGSRRCAVEP